MTDPCPLILILENDPAAAEALELLVGDCGYATVSGSRLTDLPRLAERAGEYAAIIADYHLHDGTGVEAVAWLAARGVSAPVLLMTGTLRGKARVAALSAGHRFVEKPAEPKVITRWLNEVAPTMPAAGKPAGRPTP